MDPKSGLRGLSLIDLGFRLAFWIMLAVATHQTLSPVPAEVFQLGPDTFLHLLCWSSLAVALYLAFRKTGRYRLLLMLLFLYSVSLEFAQTLVPGRFFDTRDLLANAIGCIVGYCLVKFGEWLLSARMRGASGSA